jgi:uncharacterized protein YceK
MMVLKRVIRIAAISSFVGMLSLGGCASGTSGTDSASSGGTAMNIDLSQCKQQEANLYKCPAFDLPVCQPDYAGTDVKCVRIGKKGSIIVQKAD